MMILLLVVVMVVMEVVMVMEVVEVGCWMMLLLVAVMQYCKFGSILSALNA